MRLYAFAGDGAPETAAAVARLLGRGARKQKLYVLAVDACDGALEGALAAPENYAMPPDAFLKRGSADPEGLAGHVSGSSLPALKLVGSPEDASLPASPLREAAREAFDLCVVACSKDDAYAKDWLLAADEVVGCSATSAQDALGAALRAEEVRGRNGTVLAVTGGDPTPPDGTHPLYRLGPSAGSGTSTDRGLRDLARALVGSGTMEKEETCV
jgi:hypothetical protein